MVPSCVFPWLRPTRWGASKPFSPITPAHAARARANPGNAQSRPYFAIAFAVKVGRFDFPADMIGQVSPDKGLSDRGDGRSQASQKSQLTVTHPISLFAAISTGATILAREAKYRARSDWHYSVRDTANQLVTRLNYEIPIPITRDNVAAISEEWRRRRSELGDRMAAIHESTASPKSPLFRASNGKTKILSDRPLDREDAFHMVRRRARQAKLRTGQRRGIDAGRGLFSAGKALVAQAP